MKTNDLSNPQARAWAQGFMADWWMERGRDGRKEHYDIEWHLEDLIHEICPYPTPELKESA